MADDLAEYKISFNRSVLAALKAAASGIYAELKQGGISDNDALAILKQRIDQTAITDLCPQIFALTTKEYNRGNGNLPNFDWDIEDTEAVNILRKNNVFLTSKYYQNIDSAQLRERMLEVFQSGQNAAEIDNQIRKEFDTVYRGLKSYNEMLIETATTTARNFSTVNSLVKAGVKHARIFGFKDELTCPICSRLIGRTVVVGAVNRIKDNYLAIDYEKSGYDKAIEQIKTVKPWINEKQLDKAGIIKDDKQSGTPTAGMLLPPFHARCRCELVIEKGAIKSLVPAGESGKLQEGAGNSTDAISAIRSGAIKQHEAVNKLDLSPVEKIKAHEELLLKNNQNKYETALSTNEKGDVIFAKDGSKSSVSFTPREIGLIKELGSLTHNHPASSALSRADIQFALGNGITIKALAPNSYYGNIEYSIAPKKKLSANKIKEISNYNFNVYEWIYKRYYADKHNQIEHHQRCLHLAMIKTAERYKNEVEYAYTTRNK